MNRVATIKSRIASGSKSGASSARSIAPSSADSEAIDASHPEHGRSAALVDQALAAAESPTKDLSPGAAQAYAARYVGWKHAIKDLKAYFAAVAETEAHQAAELHKAAKTIRVPFAGGEGQHFAPSGEGGVQDVYFQVQDRTRQIGDVHVEFGRFVEREVVGMLEDGRTSVKEHIAFIDKGVGAQSTVVKKERNKAIKQMTHFQSSIAAFSPVTNTHNSKDSSSPISPVSPIGPSHTPAQGTDPLLAHAHLTTQLSSLLAQQSLLHTKMLELQARSSSIEEGPGGLGSLLSRAWMLFDARRAQVTADLERRWAELAAVMQALPASKEWAHFSSPEHAARLGAGALFLAPTSGSKVYADAPGAPAFEYRENDHAALTPLHTGLLSRKKRFGGAWEDRYFVLTRAGWLHQFASAAEGAAGGAGNKHKLAGGAPGSRGAPARSWFVPGCAVTWHAATLSASTASGLGEDTEIIVAPLEVAPAHSASARKGSLLGKMGLGKGPSSTAGHGKKPYVLRARTAEVAREWRDVLAGVAGASSAAAVGHGGVAPPAYGVGEHNEGTDTEEEDVEEEPEEMVIPSAAHTREPSSSDEALHVANASPDEGKGKGAEAAATTDATSGTETTNTHPAPAAAVGAGSTVHAAAENERREPNPWSEATPEQAAGHVPGEFGESADTTTPTTLDATPVAGQEEEEQEEEEKEPERKGMFGGFFGLGK
ncbi:hypothetical protein FIBSPDRAFT_959901 [Athelia psychrophila]|uniref:PH domain-containing protein n=1 Tax=Athelia psychrophila TaxID=1759441 RepID=A0A166D026_9AGAM|nr:hypothetical protein FIBSPDRAFT_959901 [Fibularhizoctonia sp. CBS 109695]